MQDVIRMYFVYDNTGRKNCQNVKRFQKMYFTSKGCILRSSNTYCVKRSKLNTIKKSANESLMVFCFHVQNYFYINFMI